MHDKHEGPRQNMMLHQEPIFKAAKEIEPEAAPGEVTVTKLEPAELEAQLQTEYGKRLDPIKKDKKPPTWKFGVMNQKKGIKKDDSAKVANKKYSLI